MRYVTSWAVLGRSDQGAIESVRGAGRVWTTSVGVLTLLFGLWGVFGELQDALNAIWA